MSLIHCTSDCLYQQEGYCGLEEASHVTNATGTIGCLYFVGKKDAEKRARLRAEGTADKRPSGKDGFSG